MKKLLALLLAFALVFALCACTDDEEPETPAGEPSVDTPSDDTPADDTPSADAPAQEKPSAEPVVPPKQDEPVFVDHAVPEVEAKTPVEKYFELNAQAFLAFVTDDYARSSGSVCRGSLAAVGDGVTVNIYIGGTNNLSDNAKAQIKNTYDTFGHKYDQLFKDVKNDVPELKTMTINLCEEDGDKIVELVVTD